MSKLRVSCCCVAIIVACWMTWSASVAAAEGLNNAIESASDGHFVREYWAELGVENANPTFNRRFRVNAPEAALHPEFGSRSEVRSSGCLQVFMPEDPRLFVGTELYVELWGGHPGTANR